MDKFIGNHVIYRKALILRRLLHFNINKKNYACRLGQRKHKKVSDIFKRSTNVPRKVTITIQ
jgi:hypothetical protein